MSQDDATALEQEEEAQLAAEREAFEARFPADAFTGIAKALKVRPTPENLAWLRDELLPDFYSLYFSCNQVKWLRARKKSICGRRSTKLHPICIHP